MLLTLLDGVTGAIALEYDEGDVESIDSVMLWCVRRLEMDGLK